MHEFYLGGYELDIRNRFTMRQDGKSRVLDMADGNELIVPRTVGLTEYTMTAWVDLNEAGSFLDFIDGLVQSKKPTEFVINRKLPNGTVVHGTAVDVVVYGAINYAEDSNYGTDIAVEINLKEYRIPETTYVIQKSNRKAKTVKVREDIREIPETAVSTGQDGQNVPEIMKSETGISPTAKEAKNTNPSLWSLNGIANFAKGFVVNLFGKDSGGI